MVVDLTLWATLGFKAYGHDGVYGVLDLEIGVWGIACSGGVRGRMLRTLVDDRSQFLQRQICEGFTEIWRLHVPGIHAAESGNLAKTGSSSNR